MALFLQQIVTGLSIGGIYALLAVGYALIYSIFDFTNFAFGSLMMVCSFGGYFAIAALGLPLFWSILLAMLIGVIVSVFVELAAYRPLRKKKASRLFLMITAMGVDIFMMNMCVVLLGGNLRRIPLEWGQGAFKFNDVSLGKLDVLALVITIVLLIALWLFIEKTKPGLAIRASAYDTATAGLMGISANNISFIVFALSGMVAGVSGIFFGLKYAVYPGLGTVATKAFISSVIGGLGNLPGAVVGGLILGLLETIVSGYISSNLRDLFSFGILIIMLLFLPNGIMGKNIKDKL